MYTKRLFEIVLALRFAFTSEVLARTKDIPIMPQTFAYFDYFDMTFIFLQHMSNNNREV